MESFWERVVDFIALVLKAFVIFLVIRLVLILVDVFVYIPYFDDFILYMWDKIASAIPRVGKGF